MKTNANFPIWDTELPNASWALDMYIMYQRHKDGWLVYALSKFEELEGVGES